MYPFVVRLNVHWVQINNDSDGTVYTRAVLHHVALEITQIKFSADRFAVMSEEFATNSQTFFIQGRPFTQVFTSVASVFSWNFVNRSGVS